MSYGLVASGTATRIGTAEQEAAEDTAREGHLAILGGADVAAERGPLCTEAGAYTAQPYNYTDGVRMAGALTVSA